MPEGFKDKVDRILRDHEGYTGDGKGGMGALPIGDRSTAKKPISKRDLRESIKAFGDIDGNATEALLARDQAVTAAATAAADAEAAANAQIAPHVAAAEAQIAQHVAAAEAAEAGAQTAQGLAEAARDAATVNAEVYTDTAAGLAATVEGDQFQVVSGRVITRYRHDAGPVATPLFDILNVYEQDGSDDLFALIEADEAGNVIRTVSKDGVHRMTLALTPDSVEGWSVADIPGIGSVVLDQAGEVLSYVNEIGETVDLVAEVDSEAPEATPPRTVFTSDAATVPDAMWSWWVSPKFVGMKKRQYLSTLASANDASDGMGAITVAQRAWRSGWSRTEIGRVRTTALGQTDDHNAAAILLDPRPDAKWPVMVFQCDHSRPDGVIRQWRGVGPDIGSLGDERHITGAGLWTYAQAVRRPDEPDHIYLLVRQSSSGGGIWVLLRSLDNGETWADQKILFSEQQTYSIMRPSLDGTGLHFVCYLNPTSVPLSRVTHLHLTWGGVLTAAGATVSANIWGAYSAVAPSAAGAEIYTPTDELRLMDFHEFSAGEIDLVWSEFVQGTSSPSVFTAGNYFYARYDVAADSVTIKEICPSGAGIEPFESSTYVAGACITGEFEIAAATWTYPPASTTLSRWKGFDLGGTAWAETVIQTFSGKIFRPVICETVSWDGSTIIHGMGSDLAYLRGLTTSPAFGYDGFYIFDADAAIINMGTI